MIFRGMGRKENGMGMIGKGIASEIALIPRPFIPLPLLLVKSFQLA